MFNAPKGQGKTTLARATAKGLVKFADDGKVEMKEDGKTPRKKSFVEVNCSSLKNVKQFINGLIIPFVQDKDVTLLFDEASEIPHPVAMAMLTMLNPNPENRTTFSYEDYVCEFDFRKQTFLFATSEPQDIFHALLDRLTRFDLEDYTPSEMAKIVQKGAPEVNFKDGVLEDISTVLRGNARAAQKMADNVKTYLRNKSAFGRKDWDNMKGIFGILPLGLNGIELKILQLLASRGEGTPLTMLAAKTGLSREAVQKDYEMYLQKHGLMEISTTGRMISPKGLEYLRALNNKDVPKAQFRASSIVS
jgi:MoxR-like ATPase